MEKKLKLIIAIVFLLISLSIVIPIVYTLSAGNVVVESQLFDAKIYNNAQYDLGGNGLSLTKDGVDIKGWEHSNSKFLKVTTSLPETLHKPDSKNYVIGITLPKELYFSVNDFLVPTGCSKVEFKKNDNFIVNTNYTYNINSHSGTVYYTINPGVKIITIQLELKYDFDLWNKLGNNLINQKNEKSIVVNLYDKNSGGMDLLSGKAINNVYSGNEYGMTSGIYTDIDEVRQQNAEVKLLYEKRNKETLKNVYFIIAKTQSAINAYYKEIKFKIKLPQYIDTKTNKKYYLTIDKSSIKFNVKLGGTANYTVDESDIANGNIVISCKDIWFYTKSEELLSYKLKVPEISGLTEDSDFKFSNLIISAYVIDNKGAENNIANIRSKIIHYFMSQKENVEIKSYSKELSLRTGYENNIAQLGGIFISNSGTADSNKKNIDITFDIENTGYLRVTAINLPIDSSVRKYNIKYKLVDENNTLIYKDEHGNYIADNDKAKNHEFNINLNVIR